MRNKYKLGFTLAEVLITLGVIGVVSAITMPTVIKHYKVKQTVTQLKKDYSMISNAILMAKNEHDGLENWGLTGRNSESSTAFANKVKPYFKIVKDCGTGSGKECVPNGYMKYLNGGNNPNPLGRFSSDYFYKIKIANGSTIIFQAKSDCTSDTLACGTIYVDINGTKPPFTFGKDIFYFAVYKNGQVIPSGKGIDPNGEATSRCNPKANGRACAAWVIFNENMDYLDCADELSWNGKTSCK